MQVNITIPDEWKTIIDKIARKEAYEQDKDYSYLDVIRDAIKSYCKILNFDKIEEFSKDSISYIENLKIHDPIKGLINFELYDFQKRYIKFIEENDFVIVPKFRQGGFTTTTAAWALWKSIHYPHERIMFCCKTEIEAISIKKIVNRMLDELPIEIKPTINKNNNHEIEFENKSIMWFGSYLACHAKNLTYLIIDEAAFIPNLESNWKALYSMLHKGKCIILSTQNGPNTWFNQTLINSVSGRNNFKKFNCSYLECPIYQNPEYVKKIRGIIGEKNWLQEIECSTILNFN